MIPNRALERQKKTAAEGRFWHITTSPYFELDPRKQGGVVHLTDDAGLAFWAPKLIWPRPRGYVAEIEVNGPVAQTLTPDAHEWQAMSRDCRVVQVLPIEEAIGQTKLAYPDQGGGDPRPDKMGPTLNTDYAPLEDTFDALGPCQKCNNPLTRDAEGVYCPSCGYRSNPQAENARIDMYAPLGEGIGEGPFGLMSSFMPRKLDTSYWVMEGSHLPWWLPSKTAADVAALAQQAYEKLWQRDDMRKIWEGMVGYENLCDEISGAAVDSRRNVRRLDRLIKTIIIQQQYGHGKEGEPPLMRKSLQSQGYTSDEIEKVIEAGPRLAELQPLYDQGEVFELILNDLKSRYPESYKIWPWAIKQAKLWLKDGQDNGGRGYFDLTTQWGHFADIVGQAGGLITNLRQQNQLPQGFDINQLGWHEVSDWLKAYNAEHVGEGWEERNVWATLPNGWTVEEVKTAKDLQREGELMGHCVGGYCRQVQKGTSLIFSLRDPKGAPHVTFEYKPVYQETNDDGTPTGQYDPDYPNKITRLELVQVQGKSDSKPKPEYQQMVAEFNKYLQGEGYQVVWASNAWRHDYGMTDQQRQQLRHENTYDLRGIEGLHQLEHDYDRNGGTSFFTKQIPDIPDEYGVMSPSGVPEQYLNWGQLSTATDDLLYEVFEGKITPDQYEEYGRKLTVAWYSFLSQPSAGHGYMSGGGQPGSPVDARTMLVKHIGQFGSKLAASYNHQDVNQNWPAKTDSQVVMEGLSHLTAFQLTIGQKTGTQMLDWTQPAIGPGWNEKQDDSTLDFARRHRWDAIAEEPGANAGDYILQDEPGFHPEAAAPPEYVSYKFTVGKDGRIYGGQHYEHRPLIEEYGLDRDPGWTEVGRGEYDPVGDMALAEFPNSPFGAEDLANRVHQWAQTINDPNVPQPSGNVYYNKWVQGQGWDKRQFRIAAAKWSVETLSPTMPDINYVMDYNPEDERDTGWQAYVQWIDPKMSDPALLDRMNRGLQDLTWEGTEFPQGTYSPAGLTWKQAQRYLLDRCHGQAPCHQISNAVPDQELVVASDVAKWIIEKVDVEHFSHMKWSMPMTIPQQQRAWAEKEVDPPVVYEFPNGWTVRRATTPDEVHAIGLLCRNCWQDDWSVDDPNHNLDNYYTLFNQHGLPIVAFYVSGGDTGRIELPRGPRNRLIAPEEDQMLAEFAQARGLGYHDPEKYNPNDAYLDVLRERDMTDDADLRPNIDYRACPHCGHYPLDTFGRPVTYEECPKCGWSSENVIRSSWKYAADSIPANYTESDPLDLQGKQPVFDNMQVDWWKLPPVQQRQAIVNAFRATMLSPRLNLKNNAIMYQEFMSIPADESDPDVFENHARDLKERWDRQGQGDLMNEVQPIGWEKVVPGKLIPGFWGNIRRLAALGPYVDDLRQAALDDLNETGGKGTLFRNEVLKLGIPGVGPKVASFAWLALNPKGSDLATIDVWMMRHLNQEAESPNTPNHYFQLEDQLRDEKDAMYGPNTPLGQYQWGVWDKIRTPGFHQDHSPLKVHDPTPYTDVAWTQQYRAPRPQQLPEQAPGQEQLFSAILADVAKHYRIFYREPGSEDEHVATVKPELVQETLDFYNGRRSLDIDGNPFGEYVAVPYDGFVQGEA